MLILRNIKVLHLEPTDVCQAACPMCARETNINFRKDSQHHLSMDQILKVFDENKIKQLDKMFMCGNYGDPAAGKHTLEIYKEFRRINHSIVLGMNTNGAIQTAGWWQELANILNQPQDYVVFSIDGLENTNNIYRQNVDWNKLISNARVFVESGGLAHWDMLVYRHNQHQVDSCEQYARDLRFSWFRAKVSRRGFTESLQFPAGWQPIVFDAKLIDCRALQEQSVYIDAHGTLIPCCWLGSIQKKVSIDVDAIPTLDPVCSKTCGTVESVTVFDQQWQREVKLC
jgi:hypothetical protein